MNKVDTSNRTVYGGLTIQTLLDTMITLCDRAREQSNLLKTEVDKSIHLVPPELGVTYPDHKINLEIAIRAKSPSVKLVTPDVSIDHVLLADSINSLFEHYISDICSDWAKDFLAGLEGVIGKPTYFKPQSPGLLLLFDRFMILLLPHKCN